MNIKKILDSIDELPLDEQLKIYSHLVSKLNKRSETFSILEKIRGRGNWNIDAQEYVNKLRENDRF
jgi:hypothetical protein